MKEIQRLENYTTAIIALVEKLNTIESDAIRQLALDIDVVLERMRDEKNS